MMTHVSRRSIPPVSLEAILQRWRRIERGPKPRLTPIQLFIALYFITHGSPIGRYDLAGKLHENQGVIRGLLERLLENDLIETSKAGARITPVGKRAAKVFLKSHGIADLKKVEIPMIVGARFCYVTRLKRMGTKASRVVEQRDVAVRMGALGAMTILRTRSGLVIPPDNEDFQRHYPEGARTLLRAFPCEEGDVLFLSFADDEYAALAGVLAVSLSVAT